ncbi:hypothetical protein TYRP_021708 [Tyrophagus putrescentiae]|nr:hypothetical protein TYRP_021708 [Tyrophagus putrescentiae]
MNFSLSALLDQLRLAVVRLIIGNIPEEIQKWLLALVKEAGDELGPKLNPLHDLFEDLKSGKWTRKMLISLAKGEPLALTLVVVIFVFCLPCLLCCLVRYCCDEEKKRRRRRRRRVRQVLQVEEKVQNHGPRDHHQQQQKNAGGNGFSCPSMVSISPSV